MEENELIAKFMGGRLINHPNINCKMWTGHPLIEGSLNLSHNLKFNTSWDWLMPVIEECLSNLTDNRESEFHYAEIHDALWSINFEDVYKKVINFIKWYNENN